MNINRKTLFALIALVSVFGSTLPTYADVTYTTLRIDSDRQLPKRVADTSCKKKGRNRGSDWKMQNAVLGGSAGSCRVPESTRSSFKRPKMGGLRVDACISGTGWSKSDPKRCDARRLKRVGNDFCKSKGFNKSVHIAKESHNGKHAILTYKKSKPRNSYWKRQKGRSAIKKIICK